MQLRKEITMSYEIIDFHTHPFKLRSQNICNHIDNCNMSVESTKELFAKLGIDRICGSVLTTGETAKGMTPAEVMRFNNDTALELREIYGDFYIPGFHISKLCPKESLAEIERMHRHGVKLMGELVPYFYGWSGYNDEAKELIDAAAELGMVISVHPSDDDDMDELVRSHPKAVIVGAHPGEYYEFMRHLDRMALSDNYYLDLSGYGIFRHGVIRTAIDRFGPERFLFGSDYPTCNPAMYLGAVTLDPLITDEEREFILSKNAKRLLGL